jgi:hypothetical protein
MAVKSKSATQLYFNKDHEMVRNGRKVEERYPALFQ